MRRQECEGEKEGWDPSLHGPKYTIEFVLPEHQEEYLDAINGSTYKRILSDLLVDIRSSLKHQAPFNGMSMDKEGTTSPDDPCGEYDSSKDETLEKVREAICEKLQEYGVRVDL